MTELRAAYRFAAFAVLLGLAACGGGGGGDDNPPPVSQPTVTLSANPTAINSGQASTLTWSSTNATSCTASGGWTGSKATSGTEQVTPTSTATFTLSCTGTGGAASQSATITVNGSPTVTITANPTAVAAGGFSTLTWTSTNATTCAASSGWSGAKAVSGTEQVGPLSATTTYSLQCSGTGGSTSGSATVSVSTAGNVIVSGKIEFQRPPFNTTLGQGLNMTSPVVSPARQVVVEAVVPGTFVPVGAATVTDTAGNYALEVPQNTNMLIRARAEMISGATAPTWNFKVLNNTNGGALYVLDGATFNSGSVNSTRDLLATTGWTTTYSATRAAAPFAILDTVYQTKALILSAVPATVFPALNLYWSSSNRPTAGSFCSTNGNIGTTFYTGAVPALNSGNCTPQVALPAGIYILGDYANGNGDTDEFDQHVIAHEFGHYIEDKFARSDSIGGDHTAGDRLDLRVAFGEGWGNAYSGMTMNDPVYRDSSTGVSSDFGFNLETDSANAEGWFSESSVGEILWDLFDSASDGADTISLGFTPIYSVMIDTQRTTEAMTSIYPFAVGLRAISDTTQRTGINSLLAGESISSAADAFGSGEANSGGNAMALPIYTDVARNQPLNICSNGEEDGSNKLGARRLLRLTLPSATALGITVQGAVGPGAPGISQPATDPDIYVYSQGELIEAGTSTTTTPGSSETLPQRTYPAGVNILEVHDYVGGPAPHCMTVSISG